jgi:cardiolipin synthase
MSTSLRSSSAQAAGALAVAPSFELLVNGQNAFARILHRIEEAERSIRMRCFEWRDDETGQLLAQALLRAADRGVHVTILKDRVGMTYEHLEATKQSFFHKQIPPVARAQTWGLMIVYGRWGSLAQRPSALADALLRHHNVIVRCDERRFDHAKLYVFDDETVILGGMGIGDDFRLTNVDFMVEISGGNVAARLQERYEGLAAFDPTRIFDFLLHSFRGSARLAGTLAEDRLRLIASARRRLTIEMAYLGDRACTDAIVAAVNRGVEVTLLTAARANIIGDLNLYTCNEIMRRTGNPANLRIALHPRMVHGKAVVGDGAWVDVGSTNFTPLSHGAYEEVDLFCRDAALAAHVERAIEDEIAVSEPARLPMRYRRIYVVVERALSAYHSRPRAGAKRVPGVLPAAAAPTRRRRAR